MKNLILIFSILIIFINCANDDTNKQENSIIGTWKLIETYGSDGGSNPQWSTITNGYSYTFNQSGNFTSNRFSECSEGKYSISGDDLILDYGCNGFTTSIENPEGTFIEKFIFERGNLILTPTYLTCIEGCGYKFQKIE